MSDNLHGLYAIELGDPSGTPTVIGGLTRFNPEGGIELNSEPLSGSAYPRFLHIVRNAPMGTLGSMHVSKLLGLLGATGMALSEDSTTEAWMWLYFQKWQQWGTRMAAGTRGSAGDHRYLVGKNGLVFPMTVRCDHLGSAELVFGYRWSTDSTGATAPMTIVPDQGLPTDPDDTERFTLGKLTVDGTVLTSWKSIEIDFGLRVRMEDAGKEVSPRTTYLETVRPTIRLVGDDPTWHDLVGVTGAAVDHADTIIFLAARSEHGAIQATDSGKHIKFTIAGQAICNAPFDVGGGSDPGQTTLLITGEDSGALTVAVDQNIT